MSTNCVLQERAQCHLQRLKFRARYWPIYLITIVFVGCWIFNFVETSSAKTAQANTGSYVFDSQLYPHAFLFAKLYLFFVMIIVYSSAVFAASIVTYSMNSIFGFLHRNNALRIDLFHIDQCGGLSRFGNINLIALRIYALFSFVSLATALAHTQLYGFMYALFPLYAIAGFTQSWAGLRFIARSVANEKREKLEAATTGLHSDVASWLSRGEFSSDLLVLRNYLLTIRNYPYRGDVRAYLLSFFSPLAAAVGLLKAIFIH